MMGKAWFVRNLVVGFVDASQGLRSYRVCNKRHENIYIGPRADINVFM